MSDRYCSVSSQAIHEIIAKHEAPKLFTVPALLVTGLIFRNGWIIIQPSIDELMDRSLSGKRYSKIRQSISEPPGVIAVETLWIRRSRRYFHVDVHIEVDPEISVREGHNIAHRVKDCLLKLNELSIEYVNTHVEPADNSVSK